VPDSLKLTREQEQRALDIHRKSIFVNICDTTHIRNFENSYVQKLIEGGVTSVVVTCFAYEENFSSAIRNTNLWQMKGLCLDGTFVATTAESIQKAKGEGKLAIVLGSQNTEQIENDLPNLNIFHKLGLRIMGLTYQRKNPMGDGLGEKTNCGLSKLGVQVVEELNRLGILIDLSHSGVATTMEAMQISKDPVIFSHANARSLCDNIRNLTDEQMKALSENGGTIGILALSPFLSNRAAQTGSTMEDYLNQIDYVRDLVGVDHVSIGLDLGEASKPEDFLRLRLRYPEFPLLDEFKRKGIYAPKELENATTLSAITKGLVTRGYSDEEIQRVLGKNALRVFRDVWGE